MPSLSKILRAVLQIFCSRTEPEFPDRLVTYPTLTSTVVENCNAGNLHALRQELLNLLNLQNLLNMHATDYSVVVYSMHANVTSCET